MPEIILTIDGQEVRSVPGATVFEAAKAAGIGIPHLCTYRDLVPTGACRMCVVEVERARSLLASCTTPVQDGMVVLTRSPRVVEARRMILDLLLANHPADCLTCERSGSCKLQDYAYEYGVQKSSFEGEVKDYPVDDTNPFFERDHNKCILCGRCARVCEEIPHRSAIDFAFRGFGTKVTTPFDVGLEESSCVFCGNCVDACPVGALTPRQSKGQGRSWDLRPVLTICPYCGVGCEIELLTRGGKVVGARAGKGPANKGYLCAKGKFGLDFVNRPDRLTTPLIRKNGELVPASWDEAADLVVRELGRIAAAHGPESIGALSSAKCTNEENYLLQKLFRAGFGTNNVDHCARLCHASTVAGLAQAFGSGAMTNSIGDLTQADVLFVIGSNTPEAHPVIGYGILGAHERGATLIVADPRRVDLAEQADVFMQHAPGTDVALLNAMMQVIIEEKLTDEQFIAERTEEFSAVKDSVAEWTPERAAQVTGVPESVIREAARAFASAERAAIVYSMGITQHTTGTDNVLAIANLAMMCGQIGRPGTGVNPLRGQNNVQGACDMGALPPFLPGYQKVADDQVRSRFERAWGRSLPTFSGITLTEMMAAAGEGSLKALFIMGENPMVSDPDTCHVCEALGKLEFLAVMDIFPTETVQLADVVLPAACFAEKDGTFTNTERRVQLVRKAVPPPGEARADWEILIDLARRAGLDWDYRDPAQVMAEIAELTPIYGGVNYERLQGTGLQWPCPTAEHPGTPVLHTEQFTRGRGRFHAVSYRPPAETPDQDYPLVLSTGRIRYHFHTGSMTRRSYGLDAIAPRGYVEVHPDDAEQLGVTDGQPVRISSRRGSVKADARVTTAVTRGLVFMPFHYAESAANVLTNPALDPVARIPELKVCAVRLEPASAPERRACHD